MELPSYLRRTLLLALILSSMLITGGGAQDEGGEDGELPITTSTPTPSETSSNASNPNATTPEPALNTTLAPPSPHHLDAIDIEEMKKDEGRLKAMFDLREFNESCEVVIETKSRPLVGNQTETFHWYQDPCNKPRFRRFMHCNITTKRCECYKLWTQGFPLYHDPEAFTDVLMWDDWMKFNDDSNECMILPKKKCGIRGGGDVTPYRCMTGYCIQVDEKDENKFVCSKGFLKAVPTLKFIFLWVILARFF